MTVPSTHQAEVNGHMNVSTSPTTLNTVRVKVSIVLPFLIVKVLGAMQALVSVSRISIGLFTLVLMSSSLHLSTGLLRRWSCLRFCLLVFTHGPLQRTLILYFMFDRYGHYCGQCY